MQIKTNLIDKVTMALNPAGAMRRLQARATLNTLKSNGYLVPGSNKKSMQGITARPNSPSHDINPKLSGSRAISRDMAMNTPLMVAAYRRAKTNIIGAGLRLQSNTHRETLKRTQGVTDDFLDAWENHTEAEFDLWASSKHSSWTGASNFYDMQIMATVSKFVNGDMFYILPWKKPFRAPGNWPYELRVKLIEADLVRDPDSLYSFIPDYFNNNIQAGVELKNGEVVAYHIANYYSWDWYKVNPRFIRVPIRDTRGRQQVHHLVGLERVGQHRGMPWAAPVVDQLKQISRLSEASLMSALISSFFTVMVKDMGGMGGTIQQGFTPEESINGGGGYGPDDNPQQPKSPDEWDLEMGHGNVLYLDDNKEIQTADPRKTDGEFKPFFESLVSEVAAAIEIPQEVLLQQFNSSYSAARAALLEAWKFWRTERSKIADGFCKPTYAEFMREAVMKGRIDAPGFFDDALVQQAWLGSLWTGPGMGQIDPLKEAKAATHKIDNNLSTYEEEYMADRGGRWDSAMAKRSREQKTLERNGLLKEDTE